MSQYPPDAPPEALDEIRRIQSGELPSYAAKHPMARQWASEQAAQGIQFAPPNVQADPNRVAQANKTLSMQSRAGETQDQFTKRITSDPNLTAVDVEQAGAQPFVPPSGRQSPADMRATTEFNRIQDARYQKTNGAPVSNGKTAPNQTNQYVNPGSRGIVPQTHTTQAQIEQALSTPVKLTAYGSGPEHLFGPSPTPTDDYGNLLPEGQVFETGGMTFRNDARAGQATPVVFDAVKKDWVPRDSFLERKAQHDPNFNVKYRKAQSDLQSVVKSEALEPGTQFGDAMKQAQGALFSLAKTIVADPPEMTAQEDYDHNKVVAEDGATFMRDSKGDWKPISKPHHERAITPKEVADLRKTAQANVESRIPNKPGTTEAASAADPKDVQAEFDKLIEDYVNVAEKISAARARAGGATGTPAQGAPQSGGDPTVKSDADYAALPSGTKFVDPEGQTRVKP